MTCGGIGLVTVLSRGDRADSLEDRFDRAGLVEHGVKAGQRGGECQLRVGERRVDDDSRCRLLLLQFPSEQQAVRSGSW